jgi:hypothetical protein
MCCVRPCMYAMSHKCTSCAYAAGDADLPHKALGAARRVAVPQRQQQGDVMLQAARNHCVDVMIVLESTVCDRACMPYATQARLAHMLQVTLICRTRCWARRYLSVLCVAVLMCHMLQQPLTSTDLGRRLMLHAVQVMRICCTRLWALRGVWRCP